MHHSCSEFKKTFKKNKIIDDTVCTGLTVSRMQNERSSTEPTAGCKPACKLLVLHQSCISQIEYITHKSENSCLYIVTPRSKPSQCINSLYMAIDKNRMQGHTGCT